jgi:hypothetical protein
MKLNALWIILAFVPAISASPIASPITCNGGAVSVPVFNPVSVSGAVGDYTLDCTGGTPVSPPIPEIDVDVSLNVPVLNLGGWILADGADMISGTLDGTKQIDFAGVPFNPPGSGSLVLQIENILVNPSAEPPGFQFTETASITTDFAIGQTNLTQVVAANAPEPSTLLLTGICFLGIFTRSIWRGSAR